MGMATMKNCPECGKLFLDTGSGLCPDCMKKEKQAEVLVTDYLRDHPGSTIRQIFEDTGVKERTIMRMMRSGAFIGTGEIQYPCARCGELITQGTYCPKCLKELQEQAASLMPKPAPRKPPMPRGGGSRGMYSEDH